MASTAAASEILVDGYKVVYETQGPSSPSLVFVHGWTCDRTLWKPQLESLSRDFRVIALDLPGHGDSDKPAAVNYNAERFAHAVLGVMDAAGVRSAILVGHSMGLPVIREVLREAPDRVTAIISIDGALIRMPMATIAARFSGETGLENRRKFAENFFVPETPTALRTEISQRMLRTPEYVAVSAMASTVSYNWDSAGPVNTVRVLAINQKRSNPAVEKLHREAFTKLDYREIEGAGHFLHLEKPDQVNELISDFARRVTQPQPAPPNAQ